MPASLTIKNVPDDILDRLRQRAKRNHRSVQGETMAILDQVLKDMPSLETRTVAPEPRRSLTVEEFFEKVKATGLRTPAESAQMIREDRDAR